ncbi:hypothetical protein FQA39_LY08582 [Lamprigera yunnana]|nr:hypothetical protein FQA39_LY08582 [Lamprigera yunnana]
MNTCFDDHLELGIFWTGIPDDEISNVQKEEDVPILFNNPIERGALAERKKQIDDEFSGANYGVSDFSINNDNREETVFTSIENGNLSDIPVTPGEYSGDELLELYIKPEQPQKIFDFTGRRIVLSSPAVFTTTSLMSEVSYPILYTTILI